jgi:two-component sensor histidine kinase
MLSWLINPLHHADSAEVVSLIRRGTMIVLAILWLFAAVAAATASWLMVSRGIAETEATAAGLEQYARRSIELSDFVSDGFAHYLQHRDGTAGLERDTHLHPELYRLKQRLPPGSEILFVAPDGRVRVSTSRLPQEPIDLSDRRWFRAHVDEGVRSYVGPAIASRVVDDTVYTFTKSFFAADGRLLGIINLGIPMQAIIGFSLQFDEMSVAIVQHEGPLVAASQLSVAKLGKPFPLPVRPPGEEATVLGWAFGALSVATVRNLPDQQLYVIAALPLMSMMKPALWGMVVGSLLLGLFTAALLNLSRLAQRKSEQVNEALADNRILFQEVHHRVKNNLQVISSLIRMQTDRLPDEFRPVMEQTAARVRAIAMVHEQIYSAESPSVVQLDPFLKALLAQIQASMLGAERAEIVSDLEPVMVGLDQAVPVALMATEAITNAIQHGLRSGQGAITVSLRQVAGYNALQVDDTGTGPPPDIKGGLGSRIMTALARQIDGAWSLERTAEGLTRFTLTWPQELHRPAAAA